MDYNGIPLFHARKSKSTETVDLNLISGFLSAFLSMYTINTNENLEAIKFKGSKLIFLPFQSPYELIIIARVSQKEKYKNVHKELEKISQSFITSYGPQIEDWDGETNLFLEFNKNLESYW